MTIYKIFILYIYKNIDKKHKIRIYALPLAI